MYIVYGLLYSYMILYTMHTMYISAICRLSVNRSSLKTGRSGRSRDRPVLAESTVYAIGHYQKKISNTTCFELKIQCPPSQLCLQTISLFTSLFTRESESESDSGHQKYIVDFQRFPVSLTK